MATIAAGELAGLSRATALEFSFLLSIPTMTVATGYEFWKFVRRPAEVGAVRMEGHGGAVLAIGFVVLFFSWRGGWWRG